MTHYAFKPRPNTWEAHVAPVLFDTDLCLIMHHYLLFTAGHFNQGNSGRASSLSFPERLSVFIMYLSTAHESL